MVFVGFTDLHDTGQPDRFYTEFTRKDGVDLSGVEIAATSFTNLLPDRTLTPVDLWTACALLLLFAGIVGTLAHLLPAALGVPVALALIVAYAGAAVYALAVWAMIPPVATPALV